MVEQYEMICRVSARWLNHGQTSAHEMMTHYEALVRQLRKVVAS